MVGWGEVEWKNTLTEIEFTFVQEIFLINFMELRVDK